MTDNMRVMAHEWYEYVGEVALLKEDASAKPAKAQMATNNTNSANLLSQANSFTGPMRAALIKYVTGNGEGMTPEEMALLNSQFLNQNTQRFNQAGANITNSLLQRGVGGPDQSIGGNYVRGIAGLEGLKGATTAAGLRDIQLANIQQRLANKFNAAGIFAGVGGQLGQQALGYSGLANQNVSQIHDAQKPGFLETLSQSFAKGLGGSVGQGIGGVATGGLSGYLNGLGSSGSIAANGSAARQGM